MNYQKEYQGIGQRFDNDKTMFSWILRKKLVLALLETGVRWPLISISGIGKGSFETPAQDIGDRISHKSATLIKSPIRHLDWGRKFKDRQLEGHR